MAECIFCGQPADTVEHVIPKWLQNHFKLFDQTLELSHARYARMYAGQSYVRWR
jgi:hypothetical protein